MQCCQRTETYTARKLRAAIELANRLWHHHAMLEPNQLEYAFEPVFTDIKERSTVAERFIDRNLYQVYVATLWANVVLSPGEAGIEEEDLEDLHDLVVAQIQSVLGSEEDLTTVFTFISSKAGEQAMIEAKLNQTHKDLLQYFSSMILDPDGHKNGWTRFGKISRASLVTHHVNDDRPNARTVSMLPKIDTLPGPQRQRAMHYRHSNLYCR